jgi:hypothetical protein
MAQRAGTDRARQERGGMTDAQGDFIDRQSLVRGKFNGPPCPVRLNRNGARAMMSQLVAKSSPRHRSIQRVEHISADRAARDVMMAMRVRAGSVGQRPIFEEPLREMFRTVLEEAHPIARHIYAMSRIGRPIGDSPADFARRFDQRDIERPRRRPDSVNNQGGSRESAPDNGKSKRLVPPSGHGEDDFAFASRKAAIACAKHETGADATPRPIHPVRPSR